LTAVLLDLVRLRGSPSNHGDLLDRAIAELAEGLQEIRELASGLHPAVLVERGLDAALSAIALRAAVPIELHTEIRVPLPNQVQAAAYYVVAEGVANVNKHAGASCVVVRTRTDERTLVVEVVDDGGGGADEQGSGLRGLADRVEALGGTLALDSPAGGGTRLLARIPVDPR
jgi:signal transduction histidine kinase